MLYWYNYIWGLGQQWFLMWLNAPSRSTQSLFIFIIFSDPNIRQLLRCKMGDQSSGRVHIRQTASAGINHHHGFCAACQRWDPSVILSISHIDIHWNKQNYFEYKVSFLYTWLRRWSTPVNYPYRLKNKSLNMSCKVKVTMSWCHIFTCSEAKLYMRSTPSLFALYLKHLIVMHSFIYIDNSNLMLEQYKIFNQ